MPTSDNSMTIAGAKRGFATRRVADEMLCALEDAMPRLNSGDVVLARVIAIGQHPAIELPTGRRSLLNVGDPICVACGARYAPDQFHAIVPERPGPAELVAAGGIAGLSLARHAKMKEATRIEIISRILDPDGRPVNLADHCLPRLAPMAGLPIVAVAGSSMNAGKTTTSAALIRGLVGAGLKPAYVKATGTGSGGDMWDLRDAGAEIAFDFTDAGYASTYQADTTQLVADALSLAAHAARAGASVVVMEIADGVLQQETAALLKDSLFRSALAGVVFAAVDALGAIAGDAWLVENGHRVLGVSGAFTQAPLAMKEFAEATGRIPLKRTEIEAGALVSAIMGNAVHRDGHVTQPALSAVA